ncbi:MAG: SIR2 family NAD-dependent protein deacylase [Candidatus Hodarchaeales archaeon]|jgi:NAD-dependent deacetylase
MSDKINQVVDLMVEAKHIVALTGAGISAESGIPTFRGKEGYWKKGSENYSPMDLAMFTTFLRDPDLVWEWYHYRRGVCAEASPNPGHHAIAKLEKIISESNGEKQFHLVTQNVDGLHLRVGSNLETTYQVHGNINFKRCKVECTETIYEIPEGEILPKCPNCGELARPHVLWFDETYNEIYFKFNSSHQLASTLDLLFVIGTSLQTNLPYQIVTRCLSRGVPIIDINPDPLGLEKYGVIEFKEKSGEILPKIVEEFQLRHNLERNL